MSQRESQDRQNANFYNNMKKTKIFEYRLSNYCICAVALMQTTAHNAFTKHSH